MSVEGIETVNAYIAAYVGHSNVHMDIAQSYVVAGARKYTAALDEPEHPVLKEYVYW